MRRSFGVGLGAEPTFKLIPASGRKNQFADAGAAIMADSSRTVARVVFFIILLLRVRSFRTTPHKGQSPAPCRATPMKTRKCGAVSRKAACVPRIHDCDLHGTHAALGKS